MPVTTPNDDFAANSTTTGALIAGTLQGGELDWDDHDWFKLDLVAGVPYRFKLNPVALQGYSQWQVFPKLTLRDADGAVLAETVTAGKYSWAYVQYTPVAGGTYYLDVSASGGVGNYGVTMEQMEPDAVPSQPAGAPLLSLGTRLEGVFEYGGDSDWYRFHAEAGQHLQFSTPKGPAADAVYAAGMAVYDASGKLVTSNFPFEPSMSGDYYVAVLGNGKGSYSLQMTALADDFSANASTTGRFAPGSAAVSGKLDYAGDRDAFRMAVEAGKIYTVKIAGISGDLGYAQGSVSNGDGAYVASGYQRSDGQYAYSFKAVNSGDYFITVNSTAQTQATAELSYSVQADGGVVDDHGDDAAHATTAAPGQAMQGTLQGLQDTDVFGVQLQAGVTYELEAAAVQDGASPAGQKAVLNLLDGGGNQIAGGDYFTALSKFVVTPTVSGTYFAQVKGAGLAYTFKAVAAQDDYAANTSKPGSLSVGGSARGTLESRADVDWFAVDLVAGVTYWFGSESTNTTAFTKYPGPDIALVDGLGQTLAAMPTGLSSSVMPRIPYVPQTSGTYYVSTVRTLSDYPAPYVVTAQIGERDDYGVTRSTAGTLAANVAAGGKLELAQDKDMFHFVATAGTAYVVELTAGKGMEWNAGLSVSVESDLAASGMMREFKRFTPSVKVFEPQASGDYYFTVNGDGSNSGEYGLRLRPVAGDSIAANTNTTAVLPSGQAVSSVLESKYDGDWYKVAVQKDHSYVVELLGAVSGNGTLVASSATLSLTNERGYTDSVRAYTYAPYSEPLTTFKPEQDGNYYVGVDGDTAAEGSYVLQVTDITNDRKGPALAGTSLSPNVPVDLYGTVVLTFDERIKASGGVSLTGPHGAVSVDSVTGKYDGPLVAGNQLILNPSRHLEPGATYTVELKPGSITDVAGNPYSGTTSFTFTTSPLLETGTAGNDYLKVGANATEVHGGAGTDTLVYGNREYYHFTITAAGAGQFTILSRYDAPATPVKLDGVERLLFEGGGGIALDVDGIAGQAYRLYQAAFNRTPDPSGVGYWIAQMDKGMALTDVARSFVASAEFQQRYGANPTDAAFVDMLYSNVLHRAPDAAGAAYWNGALRDGLAREQALAYFSEGKENHDAVATLIANGFGYNPYG
ncbi:DUF4214 domain-containing protein [Duganella sp. FT92W]|uniref:DUF4214 domain-containing protein n=1 Tax=Pseudoduganella rivuli TaxID=2666085 RepID=A0A7X2IKL7_9BURK|nr:DUF4214 domain-containing protein [Pseudoduganella rivuli]MRV71540.1 DUF4214 domain-containing protein [Pseudoduganella rivuli]